MDDKLLFEKIKNGNEEAFEKLFRRYYSPLIRFIWGYVKSEAIAEEIVQELFTIIWEKRITLVINNSIKSYLFSASRNMSIDYLKHQKVVQGWEKEKKALRKNKSNENQMDEAVHNKLILEEVEEVIESLPQRRRLIFILSRYKGMTYKEIAKFLDISVNTVETQISRSLATLRDKFSNILASMLVIITFIA